MARRPIAREFLKRLLSLVLPLLLLIGCAAPPVAPPATPKPILVLTEDIDWGGIGHPWPIELRLVAYDNGLIIQQPVTDDPRTRPRFLWQQKTPAEVLALAAEVKAAALENVQIIDESVPQPLHMGWTDLQYWDAEKSELIKLTTYGMPCVANDADATGQWTAVARSATHPRFLDLCDALLRLQSPEAKEWYPKEMRVTLMAVDEPPSKIVTWPGDWPENWQPSGPADGTKVEFCVPVGAQPSTLTGEILDPQSDAWSQSVAVEQAGSLWWIVLPYAARVSMPSAIGLLANGPCSTAQ